MTNLQYYASSAERMIDLLRTYSRDSLDFCDPEVLERGLKKHDGDYCDEDCKKCLVWWLNKERDE